MTTTAVTTPTIVPLRRMWRNSDRSVAALVVEGIGLLTSSCGGWSRLVEVVEGTSKTSTILHHLESKSLTLSGKHKQHREIGYRPRGQRSIHPLLVLLGTPPRVPQEPRQ